MRGVQTKIYLQARHPAILHHGGVAVDCASLQDAVRAFDELPPERRKDATIEVVGCGGRYRSSPID